MTARVRQWLCSGNPHPAAAFVNVGDCVSMLLGPQIVPLDDPGTLAAALANHIGHGAPRLTAPVKWLTWKESTMELFERVDNCLSDAPDRSVLVD